MGDSRTQGRFSPELVKMNIGSQAVLALWGGRLGAYLPCCTGEMRGGSFFGGSVRVLSLMYFSRRRRAIPVKYERAKPNQVVIYSRP
jgi:hypothetical protein